MKRILDCHASDFRKMSRQDLLEKLLPAMGHAPIVVDLPDPEEA